MRAAFLLWSENTTRYADMKIVPDHESNLLICIMGGVTEEGPAETGVFQGIETDEQTYQSQ